jgi:hypothetical protein
MNIQKYNPISGHFDYYNLETFYNNLGTVIENTIGDPFTITPNVGDRYIPLDPSVGDWLGQYPNITTWDGTNWVYYTPVINDRVTITTGSNAGKTYYFDGTNWIEVVIPIDDWKLNGNFLTSTQTLGTLSNHPLPIITNNIEAIRIDTLQRVGIGTITPNSRLHVVGNSNFITTGATTTTVSNSMFNNEFQISISNPTHRFGVRTITNIIVDAPLLSKNLRMYTSSFNFTGTFNCNVPYSAHSFTTTHGNIGTNSPTSNLNLNVNLFSNININNSNINTVGLSNIQAQILFNNPPFSGSLVELNNIQSSVFFNSSGYAGSISNFNFIKVNRDISSTQVAITNLRGLFIDSTIDTIVSTTSHAILSQSVAPSTFSGNIELLSTALRLRGLINFVDVRANNTTSPWTMTLPTTAGTNGYILSTDGTGVTDWIDPFQNTVNEWIATPLTSTSTGLQGQKAYDNVFIYFCVQDNLWIRVSRDLTPW